MLAASCAHGAASAQTTVKPDAGALMQQIEQGQELQLPRVKGPSVVPRPELSATSGTLLTVKAFRLVGDSRLSQARLQAAVAPWLMRPLGFDELQKAAAAVAAAYRDAGWVVRAFLPRQEIEDGVVSIQIVQALLGQVQIERADQVRVADATVRGIVQAAQASGQPLNADALDRALLLADDLPGVAVQGLLREGKQEAETDLLLSLQPEPLLGAELGLDNTGALSTGNARLAFSVTGNSLWGLGDSTSANLVHTEGSDYLRAAWSLPVGYAGLRLGVSHSELNYRVTAAGFSTLGLSGSSSGSGLDASYALLRSRSSNLFLNLNYDRKTALNNSNGAAISSSQLDVLAAGLSGNRFDEWGGGGSSAASLTLVHGSLNLDGSPNAQADASGPQTQGSYQVLRYTLRRQQVLSAQLYAVASYAGQAADRNLDSSEKFYLGGANGVRAYPASEAGGSDGSLLNLELRYSLAQGVTLAAFYDWGQIQVNHNNAIAGAALLNSASLQGVGLSLAWTAPKGASVRLTWAHRLGSNPFANASTGLDQDGSLEPNRWWLQCSLPF